MECAADAPPRSDQAEGVGLPTPRRGAGAAPTHRRRQPPKGTRFTSQNIEKTSTTLSRHEDTQLARQDGADREHESWHHAEVRTSRSDSRNKNCGGRSVHRRARPIELVCVRDSAEAPTRRMPRLPRGTHARLRLIAHYCAKTGPWTAPAPLPGSAGGQSPPPAPRRPSQTQVAPCYRCSSPLPSAPVRRRAICR